MLPFIPSISSLVVLKLTPPIFPPALDLRLAPTKRAVYALTVLYLVYTCTTTPTPTPLGLRRHCKLKLQVRDLGCTLKPEDEEERTRFIRQWCYPEEAGDESSFGPSIIAPTASYSTGQAAVGSAGERGNNGMACTGAGEE